MREYIKKIASYGKKIKKHFGILFVFVTLVVVLWAVWTLLLEILESTDLTLVGVFSILILFLGIQPLFVFYETRIWKICAPNYKRKISIWIIGDVIMLAIFLVIGYIIREWNVTKDALSIFFIIFILIPLFIFITISYG